MDTMDNSAITRGEHEEFVKRMLSENKRLEDENNRQNHRLEQLEERVNVIVTQQLMALTSTIEKLNQSVNGVLIKQEKMQERLEQLENRDGEMWRTVVKYALTAIVGGAVTYLLTRLGV